MKMTRFLALLLSLVLLCGALASCTGDGGDGPGFSGNRGEDGSWEDVDFGGATLKVKVSAAQDDEGTFPACDIYTKGPDGTTTDEIQKKVLARNQKAASELNINVEYSTTDSTVGEVFAEIEQYVRGAAEDAPDVFDNDIYGLVRAMMNGFLWNISNPGKDANGNEVYSYFDFSYDGWYNEYMEGASFDPEKLYILAGDYHIDLIRYAWVFFTNVDLFNETFGTTDYKSYDYMVEYIMGTNEFLYDDLTYFAKTGWRDTGSSRDEIDKNDQIGICLNVISSRIFLACSGLSMVEWSGGEQGKGTPSVYPAESEGANALNTLSQKFTELYNAEGVYCVGNVLDAVTQFFDGNVVLTVAKIGEMESAAMRETTFTRGILPFPRYDRNESDFVTVVHDQAEVSCILNNASSFSMASAYLQYMNEESDVVLEEYYERGLKFKYNESRSVRRMIDFIKEHIRSPFDSVLTVYLCDESTEKKQIYDIFAECATQNKNSFASTYHQHRGSYQTALETLVSRLAAQE